MAKTYRLTFGRRLVNFFVRILLRLGVKLQTSYLLCVRGRKSGEMRCTPVTLVEEDGQRWIVAPYGEVSWVRNARAAGEVTLTRGNRSETVRIVELSPGESAPILKKYVKKVPITRSYFTATPDSPPEVFQAEASRHPVFRIVELTS